MSDYEVISLTATLIHNTFMLMIVFGSFVVSVVALIFYSKSK